MVIPTIFTNTGSPLLLSFGWGVVCTNWVKFIFFIGIPAVCLLSLLLSGSQDVLPHTLVTTFFSVTILFIVFSINIIRFRVSSCLYLIKELYGRQDDMTTTEQLKYIMLNCMESFLAGRIHNNYIYDSNVYDLKRLDSNLVHGDGNNVAPFLYSTHGQWYIKFTQLMPRLFITLDTPTRCWTQAEIDFNIPFYTRRSWSLESVFCRAKRQSYAAVVSGPSGVTLKQVYSSLACYFFGVVFYILLVAGLLVFVQAPSAVIATVVSLSIAYWLWQGIKEYRMMKHASTMIQRVQIDVNVDDDDTALFQKWETFNVTKPTPALCWIAWAVENITCIMIPLSYLIYSKNLIGAMLYVVLFTLCFDKKFFDIGPIVEELGSFGSLGLESGASLQHDGLLGASTKKEWQQKSRLYHITRMNNSASRRIWS
jgi:hypothetical protein